MEPWDDFWAAPHAGGACAPVPRPRPRGQPNPPGGRSPQNVVSLARESGPQKWPGQHSGLRIYET